MVLSDDVLKAVGAVLAQADEQGRTSLFEHEVYHILSLIDLQPPAHELVMSSAEVTPEVLSQFPSDRVVLKVVSSHLAHKQKHGGVRVVLKDLEFVRYSCDRMLDELSDHDPEGVLIAEFVEYDKDLGNEILLGFRESDAFGPVVSFSKGGSDAEHFAQHFSGPNIILAPVDNEWAHALLSSTQIHYKYLAEGKGRFIDMISDATVRLSEIACAYSSYYPSDTPFVFTEFDVNPIVFDPFGRMIPLDGYASFTRRPDTTTTARTDASTLAPFFRPKGIAVVGVSASDSSKPGNIVAENLVRLGRQDLYCVNPKGGEVSVASATFRLYTSVSEIGEVPDLVVVSVPATGVAAVIAECAELGVKAALVTAGGFAETTGEAQADLELLATAQSAGMRMMGPNCLGIIQQPDESDPGLNTFFIPQNKFSVVQHDRSNAVLISQSGAAGLVEINNLRNALSPRSIVSYGNQLDIDPCDLVRYFGDDPDVDVIGCYIEGFKPGAGRQFYDAVREIDKPIVVYKAGRTEVGRQATASHTASIAGEYPVAKAALKQAGTVVADTMLDHMGYIKTFALLKDVAVAGRGVAVVTNAGYEKTNAADNIGELTVAELEPEIVDELRSFLPSFVTPGPLLDLTPMVTDEQFARSIDVLLSSKQVDSVCVSIVPHAQLIHTTDDEIAEYRENIATRIVGTVTSHRKPAVVSVTVESASDSNYNEFSRVMEAGGVPTFLSAERAMMFLNAFVHYNLARQERNLSERLR